MRPPQYAPAACKWWLADIPVPRIWLIFGHGVKRPDDLWPFGPGNMCRMSAAAQTTFLPILAFLQLFVVELWANMRQMTTLPWPLTLTSLRMLVMRVIILHPCTKFEVRRSPVEYMTHFPSWALFGLETLTFWPLNDNFKPSILDLGSGKGQTDRRRPPVLYAPPPYGAGIINYFLLYVV